MQINTIPLQDSIRRRAAILLSLAMAATSAVAHSNGVDATGQIVHPARYQSAQQADRDEYECHMRAKGQAGLDHRDARKGAATSGVGAGLRQRMQPQRGIAPQERAAQQQHQQQQAVRGNDQRSVYDRDFAACMDVRGYVVK